jgi:DNA-binding response OmpR family regulator
MTQLSDAIAGRLPTVLLVESRPEVRARLSEGLRRAGVVVTVAAHIAEIERWPAGGTVVTDIERFTAWWRQVGAEYVIVLAGTEIEGLSACSSGADAWLPRNCAPEVLIRTIIELDRPH